MKIRKAKKEDVKSIVEFHHVERYEKQRKVFIKKSILDGNCYVAVIEGKIVGYAVLEYTFFDCGFISMLWTKEELRRKGVGTKLIAHLEKKCKKEKLFTSTNKSNAPMQKLMRKLKYKKSGIVHNLDPGDPELFYFKKVIHN